MRTYLVSLALSALPLAWLGVACTPGTKTSSSNGGQGPSSTSQSGTVASVSNSASSTSSGCMCANGCDPSGQCCASTWAATFPGNAQAFLPEPDGGAVVSTNPGDMVEISCAGSITSTVHTNLGAATMWQLDAAGHIQAVISSPGAATSFLQFSDATKFQVTPFVAAPGDAVWIGVPVGKELWGVGNANGAQNAFRFWRVDPAAPSMACESDLGVGPGPMAMSIAAVQPGMAFFGRTDGRIYSLSCGTQTATNCGCTATPILTLPAGINLRGLAYSGANLYASGFANNQTSASVYRIDLPSMTVAGTYTFHPSTKWDAFNQVATDGSHVYAVGTQGMDPADATFGSGTGVFVMLPEQFVDGAAAQVFPLHQTNLVWTVDVSSKGVLLGGQKAPNGQNASTGFAALCSLSGQCPASVM